MSHLSRPLEPDAGSFEVRFKPSRTIDVVQSDGSQISLLGVNTAQGKTQRIQGDSITVQIYSWTSGDSVAQHHARTGLIASFPVSGTGISYYQSHFSVARALAAAGVAAGIILYVFSRGQLGGPEFTPNCGC